MRDTLVLCGLTAVVLLNSLSAKAQDLPVPASLDPAFNGAGSGVSWQPGTTNVNQVSVLASVRQPEDGKIIIAGRFNRFNGTAQGCIARLNTNGSLDTTFNASGAGVGPLSPIGWGTIGAMVRLPNGKLIIGGNFTSYNGNPVNRLARLNANGFLDPTFNSQGTDFDVTSIALQPDGKIVITGTFSTYNGTTVNRLARVNADGSLDPTFNAGAGLELAGFSVGIGFSVAVQPDGKIIVGGFFTTYNGIQRNSLVRLNPDGSIDNTFNVGTGVQTDSGGVVERGLVADIAVQPDAKILIVGEFSLYNGTKALNIVRLNPDGSMDQPFSDSSHNAPGTDAMVSTVVLQPDGKILIGGIFIGYDGSTRPYLARINSDGVKDSTFDTTGNAGGLNERVDSILVQPDGKIFVGGMFSQFDNAAVSPGVARFLPGNGGFIAFAAPPVFIFGPFYEVNEGVGSAPISLRRQLGNDGRTVAKVTLSFGGATAADFSIPPIGGLDPSFNYGAGKGTNNVVNAVAILPDGKILVGGNFTAFNGDANASDGILRLNSDGTLDTSFNYGAGNGTVGPVNAIAIQPGGKILIGGDFDLYNGDSSASDKILRLNADGSLDTSFNYGAGLGANGVVNAVAIQPDGEILIGGDFTGYNGDLNASDRVLRLNPDGKLDKVFFNYGAAKGADDIVFALAVLTNGKILVGGQFAAYNGDPQTSKGIMRLDALGALDTSFNYGNNLGTNGAVKSLILQPDGKILIGGAFQIYNGDNDASDRILRLNIDGTLDTAFNYGPGKGANGLVRTIGLEPDGKIFVGGDLTTFNSDGGASDRVLRLNSDGTLDTAFNYGVGLGASGGGVNALVMQGDGKVLIGGGTSTYNSDASASDNIARLGGEFYVTWESGEAANKNLMLPVNDDLLEESAESLTLVPSIVAGNSLIDPRIPSNGFLAITDNDLTISLVSGNGSVGGSTTLTAKLTAGGAGLNNKTVNFTVNGIAFGQAVTNSSGVATITSVLPAGVSPGSYANGVAANFAGDSTFAARSATGLLNVSKGTQTITLLPLADRPFNAPDFTVSASASSGLPVSFGVIGNCTIGGLQNNIVHLMGVLGTCTVVAAQGGDTNYDAATTVSQLFNITKSDQTITFTPLSSRTFGESDFSIGATASSTLPVSFAASGQCTLNANSVHLTGAGSCQITASQNGNAFFNAAPSAQQSFTIDKANQTITFNPPANKTFGDADFAVSATGGASGNQVIITSLTPLVCSVTVTNVKILAAGTCSLRASQDGTNDYNAATEVDRAIDIARAGQTITFNNPPSRTFGDADFDVNATSSSGLTVSFNTVGPCSVTGSSVHLTGAGSCDITASQSGDSNYHPATSVQQSFTIGKASQTITFGPLVDKTFGDADFQLTATASSNLNVGFAAIGQCSLNGSTVHLTGAGSCNITASQGGDANYNAATNVDRSFNIQKGNQAITFGALANKTFGDADFTVSATASSNLVVSFNASGNCTIGGNTVHLTGAGACVITASQVGDTNYLAATDVQQSFSIGKANQAVTFGGLASKTFGDADFTVSATASSNLVVSFSASGNCTIGGNTVHLTGGGSCTITASQAGDENYNAAASVQRNFNIAKANQTITFGALANKIFGDADFTVSASASSGLAVSFAASGSCTVNANTVHLTGDGPCTITASQAGDTNYNAASNVQQSFTITTNAVATTTTVSSSQNPSNLNQNITFTATVTSTGGTPAGTVQFKDGGANLGPPQSLNGSGVAAFSTSALIAGLHVITADYSGDANFLASSGTLAGGQQVGSIIRFSATNFNSTEGAGFAAITVQRIGDLTQPVTVDAATPDDSAAVTFVPCSNPSGVASPRCDFQTVLTTLRWPSGDGSARTFAVLINQDSYVEGPETVTLTLSNPAGSAGFAAGANTVTATLTIADDDLVPPSTNPIDDPQNFVRQLYHDFLNREPDPAGLNFWTSNITSCGANQSCIENMRINTSAAFFLSIEFHNTGFYVIRMYKAAFGDIGPTAPVPLKFTHFNRDTQQVGAGVIVGQGDWPAQLANNKSDFALVFVQRANFINRYPASTNAATFVDSLISNTGNVLSDSERAALISQLAANPADPALRADVLRKIAENANFQQRQFTCAFVLMQYFGYLRRNPDAAPELGLNFNGYDFWLAKLNQFNGDFIKAEMVKAFISSSEYRQRFGP